MSGTTSQTAYTATNLASSLGVNIDPTVAAATTLAELKAVGITNVRVVDDGTAATQATLKALAAGGIRIDLVLGQTEQADTLIADAKALDAATAKSVVSLEGPQIVGHPNYTYTPDKDAITGYGKTYTGAAAGDQAAYDVFNDAHLTAANSVLASTPVITYSLATAVGAVFGEPATLGNISLGNSANTGISEPAQAAFNAAQNAASGGALSSNGSLVAANGSVSGKVTTPVSTYIRTQAQGTTGVANYAVTELGAASGAQLGNLVLDSLYVYTTNGRVPVAGAVTYVDSLTPDKVASGTAPVSLYDSSGKLTIAGTEIANLDSIITAGAGSTAAATLSLTVPAYAAGTQAADNVAVFKGPGASDNIVWWGDEEVAKPGGHGAATLGFGQVEGTVTVFDPTQGTTAVASFSNISTLSIGNFGDGPLVVQVSNTVGTVTGGASATGTFAGVSATATGVMTVAGAAGSNSTTFITQSGGQNAVTTTPTGNDIVISQGNDTVSAGGGNVTVFASGASATVSGGAGNLTFVAGGGNYSAGGGAGVDTLYGGSGSDILTGGGGANSVLVAGTGNTTLMGGAGSAAIMFGGTAQSTFIGSTGGNDQMIGGAGPNTYVMTNGDVAFGGPTGPDVFNTGTGTALIVEGVGPTQINLGGGNATAFAGLGVDNYTFTKGLGGVDNIVGLKAGDHLTLTGGFTATDASNALSQATTGSFGTQLRLTDGTQVNLFGVTLTASQISAV
jgi:serralysin